MPGRGLVAAAWHTSPPQAIKWGAIRRARLRQQLKKEQSCPR